MEIYHYHPEYKFYVGSDPADESPLEPGVYLIPAHATDIEPPDCPVGKLAAFNGVSWDLVNDYRGIYYNIDTGEEIQNTNPFASPENSTKEKPPEVANGYNLVWNNGWELEEIPLPEPLTPLQKLEAAGLTVDDLKQLLGL